MCSNFGKFLSSFLTNQVDVMFEPVLLEKCPSITGLRKIDKNFYIRPLQSDDYKHGFFDVLGQLTTVGKVTETTFKNQFSKMKSSNSTYYPTVIADKSEGDSEKIIGTATLVIERKFIHNCAIRGLIEDVVISEKYQDRGLGKLIIQTQIELAKSLGCYKITLNCKNEKVDYYKKFGFESEEGNDKFLVMRMPQS